MTVEFANNRTKINIYKFDYYKLLIYSNYLIKPIQNNYKNLE